VLLLGEDSIVRLKLVLGEVLDAILTSDLDIELSAARMTV
jgi:hypothetical protein